MSAADRELDGALRGVPSAEVAVVGAMMLDPTVLDRCDALRPEDFSDKRLGRVWAVAHRLRANGVRPDLLSLPSAIEAAGETPDIGFLVALGEAKGTAVNVEHFAELVRLDADRRRAMSACLGAADLLSRASLYESGEVSKAMREAALAADRACSPDGGATLDDAARLDHAMTSFVRVVEERWRAHKSGQPIVTTISTGFDDLDEMLGGGLMLGGIYGVGAAEKAGKTALAMQWVQSAALAGGSVILISYEVPNAHAAGRLLSASSGVRNAAMLSGVLTDGEISQMVHATGLVKPWAERVHMRFAPGTPVEYVEQTVRRFLRSSAHEANPLGLIVVDHLHCLAASPGAPRGQNDDAHLRDIVQRLANLGATSGAAVLALSQHNRDRRQRAADSPPRPTDIRGSAALVEKVWGLVQIHRPGVDPGNDVDPEQAALYVTANRYGGTGHVKTRFVGARQRFELPRPADAGWGQR